MEIKDRLRLIGSTNASFVGGNTVADRLFLKGRFRAELIRKGKIIWEDEYDNTVVTVGQNLALDTILAGSAYTVTGPFMGLISSSSYTGIAAADTMTIAGRGWLEAGGANAPTYSGTRKTAVFAAASGGAKALSAALNFTFTGGGTVKGSFIAFGSGAVNTIGDQNGTLLSAGLFTTGDRAVLTSDQLNVSYTLSG